MPAYDPLDATSPIADGPLVLSYPFAEVGDPDHILAEQRYYVIAADYEAPTISDTITVGAATLYCVGDVQQTDAEAGGVYYTRRWASVPSDRFDYQSFVATFPGIFEQRDSFNRSVTSQLEYEYFLCTTGQTYVTPDLIPIVLASSYEVAGDDLPRPPDGFYLDASTTPTKSTYVTAVGTAAFSIVAEDSTLERYMGDIWQRTTRRVKPQ